MIAAGRSEEETEKRLGAALLKGQTLISIDNVNGHLGGDALCQMITSPLIEVRVLGQSKLVQIENQATLLANGNNITLVGDVVRRSISGLMDAKMERPETRRFNGNPLATVLADRGRYIAAALTIVRAFIAAGRPGVQELDPFASFEEWSATVRGALVWLGRADPVATVIEARKNDPKLKALKDVVTSMAHRFTFERGLTAGEIVKAAVERKDGTLTPNGFPVPGDLARPDLYDALMEAVGNRGRLDGRELGKWLGRHAGRVVNGWRIIKDDVTQNQGLWKLEPVEGRE